MGGPAIVMVCSASYASSSVKGKGRGWGSVSAEIRMSGVAPALGPRIQHFHKRLGVLFPSRTRLAAKKSLDATLMQFVSLGPTKGSRRGVAIYAMSHEQMYRVRGKNRDAHGLIKDPPPSRYRGSVADRIYQSFKGLSLLTGRGPPRPVQRAQLRKNGNILVTIG